MFYLNVGLRFFVRLSIIAPTHTTNIADCTPFAMRDEKLYSYVFNAILVIFLLKKQTKFNKIQKNQKFKILLLIGFLYFFSAYTCQFMTLASL